MHHEMTGQAMFSVVFTDAKDRRRLVRRACLQTIAACLA
ncbi:hypothetical protein PAMC26510_34320 [Caballeronia sordidicola]|uniref:Uncharacterized protein n=1 Tax=Caballeronia sordidicola TaxID=196367 RepID=A0A242M6U8_CABSO|nr:hypothetical protein PAMC26510_34320 [Caballeronia sordidicola]